MKLTTILKSGCTLAMLFFLTASDCHNDDGYYGYGSYIPGFMSGGYGYADPCNCDGGYYDSGYYGGAYFEGGYYDSGSYDDGVYYEDDFKTKFAGKRKK